MQDEFKKVEILNNLIRLRFEKLRKSIKDLYTIELERKYQRIELTIEELEDLFKLVEDYINNIKSNINN